MPKLNLNIRSVIFLFALFSAIAVVPDFALAKTPSKGRIQFLVNEMTTTPERQQIALDEIAGYDDEAVIYLFSYFSDERLIAAKEVKFLNTSPGAIEKYFLTTATKVREVAIQYFCWRTARCTPSLMVDNLEKIQRQFEIDFKTCKPSDGKHSLSCRDRARKP
ncbi:hypothetical protein ACO0K3_15200 [Undibacterium sp. Rencai35W]|uniref:hypothetical protein n=1 Tax=Undibacterium sp. Rencai35W TaxID=3413046 RepID=UPI003BF37AD3